MFYFVCNLQREITLLAILNQSKTNKRVWNLEQKNNFEYLMQKNATSNSQQCVVMA